MWAEAAIEWPATAVEDRVEWFRPVQFVRNPLEGLPAAGLGFRRVQVFGVGPLWSRRQGPASFTSQMLRHPVKTIKNQLGMRPS